LNGRDACIANSLKAKIAAITKTEETENDRLSYHNRSGASLSMKSENLCGLCDFHGEVRLRNGCPVAMGKRQHADDTK